MGDSMIKINYDHVGLAGLVMFFGSILGIVLSILYEMRHTFVKGMYDIFFFVTDLPYGTLITIAIIGFLLAFPAIASDMEEVDDRP